MAGGIAEEVSRLTGFRPSVTKKTLTAPVCRAALASLEWQAMSLERLMWIFAGLFVFFGLLLGVSDETATRNLWGGLSAGSLGCFALSMAADGVHQGRIRIGFDVIERAAQPRLFAAAVGVVVAAGLGTLSAAVWVAFLKPVLAVAVAHETIITNAYT